LMPLRGGGGGGSVLLWQPAAQASHNQSSFRDKSLTKPQMLKLILLQATTQNNIIVKTLAGEN
jgi:hypothetical protein